jgi:hypothetical protein
VKYFLLLPLLLMAVQEEGDLEVAKALASVGADLDFPMNDGVTRVCIAAEQGHSEVVMALGRWGRMRQFRGVTE